MRESDPRSFANYVITLLCSIAVAILAVELPLPYTQARRSFEIFMFILFFSGCYDKCVSANESRSLELYVFSSQLRESVPLSTPAVGSAYCHTRTHMLLLYIQLRAFSRYNIAQYNHRYIYIYIHFIIFCGKKNIEVIYI